jgi:hypothetical protein
MATINKGVPLQPIPAWGGSGDSVLGSHLGTTDYLLAQELKPSQGELSYSYETNEDIWRAIIYRRVSTGMDITLRNFQLLDWFPRAPGLYYTDQAGWARDEAFHYLDHDFGHSPIRDHANRVTQDERPLDYTVVFTPAGKWSMLQGGIGAIRLKPVVIFGESHWLMTALSVTVVKVKKSPE